MLCPVEAPNQFYPVYFAPSSGSFISLLLIIFFFIPDYPDMTLAPILNYNTICKAEISVCFLFDTKILMITGTPLGELTLVCHTGPGKKILTLAEPTRTIKQE